MRDLDGIGGSAGLSVEDELSILWWLHVCPSTIVILKFIKKKEEEENEL